MLGPGGPAGSAGATGATGTSGSPGNESMIASFWFSLYSNCKFYWLLLGAPGVPGIPGKKIRFKMLIPSCVIKI
jgi:hypothetical protein